MNNQPFFNGYNQQAAYPQVQAGMSMQNWNQPTMNVTQRPEIQPTSNTNQTFSQPNRSYMPGRLINDISEVRPNEVPADGSPVVFPLMDRSRIFVKEMTENGTIATSSYVRENPQNPSQETNAAGNEIAEIMNTVLNRLENIEKTLKKNNRRYYQKPAKKKEE